MTVSILSKLRFVRDFCEYEGYLELANMLEADGLHDAVMRQRAGTVLKRMLTRTSRKGKRKRDTNKKEN